MKISELIARLQELQAECGDLPVIDENERALELSASPLWDCKDPTHYETQCACYTAIILSFVVRPTVVRKLGRLTEIQ